MAAELEETSRNRKVVFVVYGRHETAKQAMFGFLTSIGLQPLEWSHLVRLTGKGSPYVGEVLDVGFKRATAAVVLFTPDDQARLCAKFHSINEPVYETQLTGQARPNVIFEAGMALGIAPDQTILVELGSLRPISDLAGRHVIRIDNTERRRRELAERLETAGCTINLSESAWRTAGDFDAAIHELSSADEAVPPIDLHPRYSVETSRDRGQFDRVSYEIKYPQIQGLATLNVQRRVNRMLKHEFEKFAGIIDDQGQPRQADRSEVDNSSISTSVSFELGLTTETLISLRADILLDAGGAHPTNWSTGFLIDLISGYRYNIDDLFRSDLSYKGILSAHIRESLRRDFSNDPTQDYGPSDPVDGKPGKFDFYLSERDLVIVNLFEIHALSALWARIPFSDLVNVAEPDGPLHTLLVSRSTFGETTLTP